MLSAPSSTEETPQWKVRNEGIPLHHATMFPRMSVRQLLTPPKIAPARARPLPGGASNFTLDQEIKNCIHQLTAGSLGEGKDSRFHTIQQLHGHLLHPAWPHREHAQKTFLDNGGANALRWTHEIYNRPEFQPEISLIELIAEQVNRDPEHNPRDWMPQLSGGAGAGHDRH